MAEFKARLVDRHGNPLGTADNPLKVKGWGGGGGPPYVLPIASTATLGGIKVGNHLEIDGEGILSVATTAGVGLQLGETSTTAYRGDRGKTAYDHSQSAHAPVDAQKNVQSDWLQTSTVADDYINNKPSIPDPYVLPIASTATLGGIKVGANLTIEEDGTLSATGGGGGPPYVLPIASTATLGGIKVGNHLEIDGEGILSVATTAGVGPYKILPDEYTLPTSPSTGRVIDIVGIGYGWTVLTPQGYFITDGKSVGTDLSSMEPMACVTLIYIGDYTWSVKSAHGHCWVW